MPTCLNSKLSSYYVGIVDCSQKKLSIILSNTGIRIINTILAVRAPVSADALFHGPILISGSPLSSSLQWCMCISSIFPWMSLIVRRPIWCATITTTCRLMIKLRQIDHNHDQIRPNDISDESIGVAVHDEYDELVQSGVHVEMLRSVGPSTPIRSSGTHY